MKKSISLVMALALAMGLVACGGNGASASQPSSTSASQSASTSAVSTAAEGDLKAGLGIVTTGDVKGEASADEDGKVQTEGTVAAVLVDAEGKIVDCKLDAAQITTTFTTEGKVQSADEVEVRTKQEKGADYGMVGSSDIGKEWNEQADAFAAAMIGKTADEVNAIALNDKGNVEDADLAASCTVNATDFKAAVVAALNNATVVGAAAGDKLGMGVVTTVSTKEADEDSEGKITHETTYALSTIGADGKITSSYFDVAQVNYTVAADGTVTAAPIATKQELGADYGMAGSSGISKEWNEQANAFAAFVVGKTADEVNAIALNEKGAVEDADLAASCTVNATDFKAAFAKAAA